MIIDDFWSEEKSDIKRQVADETGVTFVDFKEIRGVEEYKCGLGAVVYDSDGIEHVVEHEGVASHPGDDGMRAIAERTLEKVE